jgi:hypothetical protein
MHDILYGNSPNNAPATNTPNPDSPPSPQPPLVDLHIFASINGGGLAQDPTTVTMKAGDVLTVTNSVADAGYGWEVSGTGNMSSTLDPVTHLITLRWSTDASCVHGANDTPTYFIQAQITVNKTFYSRRFNLVVTP